MQVTGCSVRNSPTECFTLIRFSVILVPNLVGAGMKVTRVIAVAVMAGTAGLTALDAQSLRDAAPPAEFPPASYTGNQYVDSRGCIYIRAGIDGNVTWVPRVSRDRKQVCGYKPTAVAGSTKTPQQSASVEQITLPPTAQPTATAKAPAPTASAAPAPAQPKPVQPAPTPTAVKTPPPTTVPSTKTTTKRPPTTTTAAPAPVPRTTVTTPSTSSGGCSNASTFSQQFINKKGVRCGPQTESPVTPGRGSSLLGIDPDTRIVPRHVYENRQNTRNVSVPAGYRTVWKDDRLNPYRAERTAKPAVITNGVMVPVGFRFVNRDDNRLNPYRGERTALGNAEMNTIWSNDIPRTLVPFENTQPVIILTEKEAKSTAEAEEPYFLRISTRSASGRVTTETIYAADYK